MVPSGASDISGTSQAVPASLLRSSSGLLGAQNSANAMPSQLAFPANPSPRTQFNNPNMVSNASNQSFGNSVTNWGSGNMQRGVNENGAESGNISGNAMAFNSQQPFIQSNMVNSGSASQMQGQQFSNPLDQQSRQFDPRNFQLNHQQLQQLSASQNQTNFNTIKLEPQQGQQNMRSVNQQSDQSLSFQQQQQQQQMLQMARSSSQAPVNLLHQQRLLQFQQQQQQQQLALKSPSLQRPPSQTPFQTPNLSTRPPPLKQGYEPGMGARRLTRYTYEQQNRPRDNNFDFWRKFVAEFFAPNAKKKWCVSMYGNGRQTTGIFPQDVWQCEICNRKPGRGFEATAEVLPRLFKIKFESGTLEELLYVDMPREYQNPAGQIVLDYAKAIQESVFDQLRVVRDGQLRIVFTSDLKICSWEFCARRHEELIPRRLLTPQVSQLGAAAQKYQASTQNHNGSSTLSAELQDNCNSFVASAKQVAKALEVPLVNDLGYSKRYVRCLQIAEVVNSLKDLIDYSAATKTGPMESLAKYVSITRSVGQEQQVQQPRRQTMDQIQISNNDQTSQVPSTNGVPMSANRSLTSPPATLASNSVANLLHQNSMNSRSSYQTTNGANSPLPNSPFQQPTPTTSNNGPQNSRPISMQQQQQQQALSGDDAQSSVQKIINQLKTTTQSGVGNFGNDMRNFNRVTSSTNGAGVGNAIQGSMGNEGMTMNARVGTSHQQGFGAPLLSGIGAVNGYSSNLQFDWKPSP